MVYMYAGASVQENVWLSHLRTALSYRPTIRNMGGSHFRALSDHLPFRTCRYQRQLVTLVRHNAICRWIGPTWFGYAQLNIQTLMLDVQIQLTWRVALWHAINPSFEEWVLSSISQACHCGLKSRINILNVNWSGLCKSLFIAFSKLVESFQPHSSSTWPTTAAQRYFARAQGSSLYACQFLLSTSATELLLNIPYYRAKVYLLVSVISTV